MNNQENADVGLNAEHLLANTLTRMPKAWANTLASLGYANVQVKEACVIGGAHRKADVEINFVSKHAPIRVNVKSFKGGYNQIERRNLSAFCRLNRISQADEKFLQVAILRKQAGGRGQPLFEESEHARVLGIFSHIAPGVSALVGNDHPQLLALYNSNESKWHIYNMSKQVLPLCRGPLGFTSQASNLSIGKYVALQRKGGDSNAKTTYKKTQIKHPSNDVQLKMWVSKFFSDVAPVAWYVL